MPEDSAHCHPLTTLSSPWHRRRHGRRHGRRLSLHRAAQLSHPARGRCRTLLPLQRAPHSPSFLVFLVLVSEGKLEHPAQCAGGRTSEAGASRLLQLLSARGPCQAAWDSALRGTCLEKDSGSCKSLSSPPSCRLSSGLRCLHSE